MKRQQRPLSPHLQVYRFTATSLMSIAHRITGVLLNVLLIYICVGLFALARGHGSWHAFYTFSSSSWVLPLIAAGLFSFYLHLFNGLRHLIWDLGIGIDKVPAQLGAWLVAALSLISAAVSIWWMQ